MIDADLTHSASPEIEQAYANLDSLPAGSVIIVSFDFEASSLPEVKPLAETILHHAFSRDLRVIGVSFFAEGTALGEQILSQTATLHGKQYGLDYAYLGFRPLYWTAMLNMGESIAGEFPLDYHGEDVITLPLFQEVRNYDQIGLVVSVADGSMPTYWVEYAVTSFDVNLEVALTATMATAYYPYLASGQIKGLLAGLKGAAEYELLSSRPGGGKRGLLALSVSQAVLILIIVAGNVADYRRRRN
jgi:hypothetical protein